MCLTLQLLTTLAEWSQNRNIIKVRKQLHLFLIVFSPLVPHFPTWKLISTTLVTGTFCSKIVPHRCSAALQNELYTKAWKLVESLRVKKSGYPHTLGEPHMLTDESWHQVAWANPLREETTPVLLRQWSLMPPASGLRSRRIHHGTDGCMINIHWMKSRGSDLSQCSFTFYSLLGNCWKFTNDTLLWSKACFFGFFLENILI